MAPEGSVRSMSEVEHRAAGFGCRIGVIGPVLVSVFDTKAELPMLDLLDQAQTELIAKHGRIATIAIIAMERMEPPDPQFRTRGAALAKKHEAAMTGSAMVVLSKGLAAVVVRAFLAAYSLLFQQKQPNQTFREIAPAVKWLQGLDGQLPEVKAMTGLTVAVEAFTAKKAQ